MSSLVHPAAACPLPASQSQLQMPPMQRGGCLRALGFLWLFAVVETKTRTYYLGIVEENWDYAPSGKNLITGQSLLEDK